MVPLLRQIAGLILLELKPVHHDGRGPAWRWSRCPFSTESGSGSLAIRARRLPSGDQAYWLTPPGRLVIRSASPPPRLSSHTCCTSCGSSRSERNARYRPSGLQRGVPSLEGEVVSRSVCRPSQLVIQRSRVVRSFDAIGQFPRCTRPNPRRARSPGSLTSRNR